MSTKHASHVAFTPAVKEAQRRRGSRNAYEKMGQSGSWNENIDESLAGHFDVFHEFLSGVEAACWAI